MGSKIKGNMLVKANGVSKNVLIEAMLATPSIRVAQSENLF